MLQIIFFLCEVKGDVYRFFRSLPSGALITIFANCFVNSIHMRMAWFNIRQTPFRDSNCLKTFGDDLINGTKCKDFNMVYISNYLAKYGIDFTSADKSVIHKEFSTMDTITFLKRGFRVEYFNGERYALCPLSEISIIKMLCFTDCDPLDQDIILLTNLVDAHKQYFFHGREKFEYMTVFFIELLSKCGLKDVITYDSVPLHWYN